jgi:hypothetical protein
MCSDGGYYTNNFTIEFHSYVVLTDFARFNISFLFIAHSLALFQVRDLKVATTEWTGTELAINLIFMNSAHSANSSVSIPAISTF